MGGKTATSWGRAGVCEVCGVPVPEHQVCRDCEILVGPGHVSRMLVGGLCGACWEYHKRKALREGRTA